MVKKHFLLCAAGVSVLLILNFLLYLKPDWLSVNESENQVEEIFADLLPLPKQLFFAGEEMPLHDKHVNRKLAEGITKTKLQGKQARLARQNARRWFKVIEPILAKHGVPDDFKYVPFIESGFGSDSSVKGASGFWQFMPATARSFGLRVDSLKDERHDIIKSTNAACVYLKELHKQFDSWTMTAAAYNLGSTKLARQSLAQEETDYYKLHLNKETAAYLYKLMAVKLAMTKGKARYQAIARQADRHTAHKRIYMGFGSGN